MSLPRERKSCIYVTKGVIITISTTWIKLLTLFNKCYLLTYLLTHSLTHSLTYLLVYCTAFFLLCIIMPPSLIGDAFVWRMSVWRLSVVYIGPNSRTQRPRKTKIGTEVGHVTRDPDTTFKVKRSKVKVTRPLWLVVLLAGKNGHTVMVSYPYACMTYIVSPLAGLGGGISATAWF